jgi:Zn-finger protein
MTFKIGDNVTAFSNINDWITGQIVTVDLEDERPCNRYFIHNEKQGCRWCYEPVGFAA